MQPPFRVGFGFDTHRIADGGSLRLGGVLLPHPRHLVGHSDADVLLHAIADALLGALALPDLGQLFPNTDLANRDRDSSDFVVEAMRRVRAAGWELANLDCVVSAQQPKLAPHLQQIRTRIAEMLNSEPDRIGLKGKTGEHVGPVGQEEAIEARCVALIYLA